MNFLIKQARQLRMTQRLPKFEFKWAYTNNNRRIDDNQVSQPQNIGYPNPESEQISGS